MTHILLQLVESSTLVVNLECSTNKLMSVVPCEDLKDLFQIIYEDTRTAFTIHPIEELENSYILRLKDLYVFMSLFVSISIWGCILRDFI